MSCGHLSCLCSTDRKPMSLTDLSTSITLAFAPLFRWMSHKARDHRQIALTPVMFSRCNVFYGGIVRYDLQTCNEPRASLSADAINRSRLWAYPTTYSRRDLTLVYWLDMHAPGQRTNITSEFHPPTGTFMNCKS